MVTGPRRALVKRKAQNKGLKTVGAAVGTVALFLWLPWLIGLGGLAGTGYLAYDWLKYRGKWGLRF